MGDGERKEEYQSLVKELNIENKVKFLGVRNDIPKILKITDICVLSSNWEGFGLAAIESMAAGKPVIASNVAGLKQIVEGNGLVFEKGNEKDLEEKIRFLLNDKKKYEEISRKCLEKSKEYDIQKIKNKIKSIYFLGMLVAILFCGLREGIGKDFYIDKNIFEKSIQSKGYLIYFMVNFLKSIKLNYSSYFLFMSFINIVLVFLLIHNNIKSKINKRKEYRSWLIYF